MGPTFGRPYGNAGFAKSEAVFSKTLFEARRRRGEFGFVPPEISSKIVGFAYSLDFFGSFLVKQKRMKHLIVSRLRLPQI